MAEDDKNASLSTTTKHLTTSFEEAVKLWRLTVLVKTMETNYYHVTRLITTLQSYKERRTRSFDAVIVVIDITSGRPPGGRPVVDRLTWSFRSYRVRMIVVRL
jgi:hypothetical protein